MMRRSLRVELLMVLVLVLAPAIAMAQSASSAIDVPERPREGVSEKVDGEDATKDGEKKEGDSEEEEKTTVAINLNKVNIDQIIKFLTEITGKFVVKHKDVNAQITVFSAKEVSKEKAFKLIVESLLLEKVAVVETADTIRLVPMEMLSEVVIELQPTAVGDATAGIVKTVIPVRFADVSEIEALVKPLLSKTGSIMAHPASKQLIITDTATRVASIQAIVTQVDVLDTEQTQVDIIPLKHASAEAIAPILQSVLSAMMEKPGGGSSKPPQPGQPPSPGRPGGGGGDLQVVAYKEANWLVVVAPKEILAAARPLVEQLDGDRPDELTLRIIPVKYASSDDVAAQLKPLFEKRPDRVKDTVEVTAHSRSSSLLVRSSEENYEL
ncbi:MAG: hypothetical protein GY851_30070, partial [bacterium]|nr:hypothetical protein [bacterium]